MQQTRSLSLLLALLVVAQPLLMAPTVNAQVKPIKGGVRQEAAPAGMVPVNKALPRLDALLKTIEDRQSAMSNRYDYKPSVDTLRAIFAQSSVNADGQQYLDSWSQNGLYLTWDVVNRYYGAHREAIQNYRNALTVWNKPYAKETDLAYFEKGMKGWTAFEPTVSQMFDSMAKQYGPAAHFLGKKIATQRLIYTAPSAAMGDVYRAEAEALGSQAQASNKISSALDAQLRDIGYHKRFFSDVNDPNRVETKRHFTIGAVQLDDQPWRDANHDTATQQRALELAKQSLSSIVATHVTQAQQALAEINRIQHEKTTVKAQLDAAKEDFEAIANPQAPIPNTLKSLVAKRDRLQQRVTTLEDQIIAAQKAGKKDGLIEGLLSGLTLRKQQLAQTQAELDAKVPKVKPDETAVKTALETIQRLDDAWWELAKQEAHHVSDYERYSKLLAEDTKQADENRKKEVNLQAESKKLLESDTPFIETIRVTANGNEVYHTEWKGPFDALRELEAKIQSGEQLLATVKTHKQESWQDFYDQSKVVQNTLTRLHGTSVSQGNGVLATLTDVWNNDGAIFHNARGQAAIDFGMNAYEVFVEGWGKGGPGGAAVECLHKVMLAGVEYGTGSDATGVLDFSKYNATAMQQEANKQYGADLSSPTSLAEITKTAINRGIEDGLTRHARDFGNRTLGVAIQRGQVEALRGGMQASLRQGLYSGGPTFANALQNDMNRLAAVRKKLSGLKVADAYKGADFLKAD